jgi:hypothetical protein
MIPRGVLHDETNMRLYSYSKRRQAFAEVTWITAKAALCGILLVVVALFGIAKLNQSVTQADGSRSAKLLEAENRILRHQLELMAPHLSELETQAGQLDERINFFRALLNHPRIAGDSALRIANDPRVSHSRPAISAARIFHP